MPSSVQVTPLASGPGPIDVFVSYAHEDEHLRKLLEQHLAPMMHAGRLNVWHDRQIMPGEDFSQKIDEALNECGLVLLLVSPAFMSSNYCWGVEMKRALELRDAGRCVVVPIMLRPCQWDEAPFGRIQMLPKDARPITTWDNQDTAFLDVANGLRTLALEITHPPKASVTGTEDYSPTALVALRLNSFLRTSGHRPNSLVLICPDHAYQYESFLVEVLAINAEGKIGAATPVTLRAAEGQFSVKLPPNGDDHEAAGFLLTPTGEGTNYMVIARTAAQHLVLHAEADGYASASATIFLGKRP